jgi:isoleucyl-tRNA synthetase
LGQDDFKIGIKHNLTTTCAIDELGKYVNDDKILNNHGLNGLLALDENTTKKIKSILNESVLHEHDYIHSYPYDWRTKKPCIIRSSMQWFIDTNKLKEDSLNILKNIRIRPNNVSNSMTTSLSSRPYWCISRQRSWGLPIPCFYDKNDKDKKNAILDKNLIENLKQLIRTDGNVDFWWTNKYDQRLKSNNENVQKSSDIFDIWFDSGSSYNCVLDSNENTADLYCEGVDQFSGWFQSSLLLSVAQRNQSPYKNLLVHGFVVDENNRKMSKSIGNVIEPIQAIRGIQNKLPQAGIDVLRFWVTHEYYKPQIQIGPQIIEKFIKRVFEIRSILRFIVGNLNDMDGNLVEYENMLPLDKYILNRLNDLLETVVENYEDYNLSKSLITTENFFLTQLSSFYIKSIKDRLYCDSKNSFKRRSAQSALYHILSKSLVMLAPILPHLTEEAYYHSILKINKNNDQDTLFRSNLNMNINQEWNDKSIDSLFEIVEKIRNKYYNLIQSENSAIYDIKLECNQELYNLLKKYDANEWLIECFGCSNLHINQNNNNNNLNEINSFQLTVDKINDKKHVCIRCRKYNSNEQNTLCDRCNKVISN